VSRIERKFKKEAESIQKQILARSDDKYKAYLAEHYPQTSVPTETVSSSKPRFKMTQKFAFVAVSVLIVITALVVSLIKLLPKNNNGGDDDKVTYYQDKEVVADSSLESLNNETQRVKVILAEELTSVTLIYDAPSGDHLYYRANFDNLDTFEMANVYVIVNANYHNEDFSLFTEPLSATINGFEVKYAETFEFIETDGFYSVKNTAVIVTGKEYIYITYEALSLDESSNFLNWLEQTIMAK
jgi:hypothetical protein